MTFIDMIGIEKFVREADHLAQLSGPRFASLAWLRHKAKTGRACYSRPKEVACAA